MALLTKERARLKRKKRVRSRISGDKGKPRMCVFRSNKHIYVQLIDDQQGRTILSASSQVVDMNGKSRSNRGAAEKVGELIAKLSSEKGIDEVVFDRNGYLYHGRVKALADSARKAGLKF